MVYSFDKRKAADRTSTQYFEIFGNRAIYHDGWLAGTLHRAPWEKVPRRPWRMTCGSCSIPARLQPQQ